jgi:hypothetical protein
MLARAVSSTDVTEPSAQASGLFRPGEIGTLIRLEILNKSDFPFEK